MGKGLTRQVLEAVRRSPTWVNRLAKELNQRTRETKTILRRLEERGLIYSRLYTWTGPDGADRPIRAYLPAGKADGLPIGEERSQPDLPTREVLKALQPSHTMLRNVILWSWEALEGLGRVRRRPLTPEPALKN